MSNEAARPAIVDLPSDAQRRIAALPPELRDIAARLYPTDAQERRRREQNDVRDVATRQQRAAWLKTVSGRALNGDFGTAIRLAAEEALRSERIEEACEDILVVVMTERERRANNGRKR